MLPLALLLSQLALPSVTLVVGQKQRVNVGKPVQRIIVSGGDTYSAQFPEQGVLEVVGHAPGATTVVMFFADGSRASFPLRVVQPKAKPVVVSATQRQSNGVSVIEIPESLVDVSDVREVDGGIVLTGRNEKGQRIEVTLTPR